MQGTGHSVSPSTGPLPAQTTDAPTPVCRMWHTNERYQLHTEHTSSSRIGNVHNGPPLLNSQDPIACTQRGPPTPQPSNSTCWASPQQTWLTCHFSSQTSGKLSSTTYSCTSRITVGIQYTVFSKPSAVAWQYVSCTAGKFVEASTSTCSPTWADSP